MANQKLVRRLREHAAAVAAHEAAIIPTLGQDFLVRVQRDDTDWSFRPSPGQGVAGQASLPGADGRKVLDLFRSVLGGVRRATVDAKMPGWGNFLVTDIWALPPGAWDRLVQEVLPLLPDWDAVGALAQAQVRATDPLASQEAHLRARLEDLAADPPAGPLTHDEAGVPRTLRVDADDWSTSLVMSQGGHEATIASIVTREGQVTLRLRDQHGSEAGRLGFGDAMRALALAMA